MPLTQKGSYRFGSYVLDLEGFTLHRAGETVLLPPKLFELLAVLVSRRGAIVTKEQLLAAVWADSFVEESNLTQSIFTLRRKLGKTADGDEYIQTVPRRGYRLNVPVEEVAAAANPPSPGVRLEADAPIALSSAQAVLAARSTALPGVATRSRLLWLVPALVFLVAMVVTAILLRIRPADEGTIRYVQLTRDGMEKRGKTGEMGGPDAALATDGTRIYFTEGASNAPRLVQVSVAGGETVTIPLPFSIAQLFDYSQVRSELLVGNYDNPAAPAQLWAVSLPGGAPHRVGEIRATDAAWSPDGSQIAFVTRDALFLASSTGAGVRQIALLPGVGWRPRWSSDGRRLSLTIVGGKSAEQSLWEIDTDGSHLHPLLPGWNGSAAQCCGMWTSDGKAFVFQATQDGKTEIWSLAQPGLLGALVHSKPQPVQVSSGPGDSLMPAISPDGSRIFVINRQLRGELVRYDPNAHQFLPSMNGASFDFLEFSRDGQWITYVAYPEGTLWRSRPDGSDRLQLTFSPMQVMVPHWSPDGRQIAFRGFGEGQPDGTYTIAADGGTPHPVSPNSSTMMNAVWSPDGRSLLYSDFPFFGAKPENVGLHILDLESRQVTAVPRSQGLISPSWSPDGRYFTAFQLSSQQQIMLFDRVTQSWSALVEGWGLLRWSQDGQYLYYLRYGTDPAIMRVRLADHDVETVTDLTSLRLGGRLAGLSFSLDPDGRPVVLRDTGTQEIYALELQPR